jgi:transposase
MSNQTNTVLWKSSIVIDEDFSSIASKFKLSYALVAEVVEQLRQKGSVNLAQWSGQNRDRIKDMLVEVFVDDEEASANESVAFSALDDDEPYPDAQSLPHSEPVKAPDSPVETFEPAPATEVQEIVSDAAISLIQAMADTGEGHFIIEPDGCCSINRDNPPELTHAYQVVNNVLRLRELAPAVDDKSAWMLGSVVASLEEYFGEDFSISQVCEMTEQSENTIYQKVNVYKRFKDKRYNLSYSHHQEAHMSKLFNGDKPRNAAAQELVLSKCESYGLNKNHVRDLCSIIKRMEDEQVVRNIRSKDQAMALIDSYKESKVVYYVYDEGVWSEIKGLDGQIPSGKVVLDTKNKKAHANGQSADIIKPS